MTEILYGWMKNLACYFILLSAVMHLLPDNSYKKYVQYYMGLLLILILLSPVFQFLKLDDKIGERVDYYIEEEDRNREHWENYAGEIEKQYNGTGQEGALTP